jgi:hypothetical protein
MKIVYRSVLSMIYEHMISLRNALFQEIQGVENKFISIPKIRE